MLQLDDYIDRVMKEPGWSWGRLDCCFFAGDWIVGSTGLDPLSPYRGAYDSAIGVARLIAARGGLPAMVGAEMERCGFPTTGCYDRGDIGVTTLADGPARASVVICLGAWWCGLTEDGIIIADMVPVIGWRVGGMKVTFT